MANIFVLFLTITTLVTGIVWCLERFKWAPARKAKVTAINITDSNLLDNIQKKIAKQPRWIEHTASIFPVLALVFIMRSFIYEPFQIPSGSMMPTLLIGDFILVNKYTYGIKDPISLTTLIPTSHPKRGDIAVFKYPLNLRLNYIKRIIGLPGDRVSYDPISKKVIVQPSCSSNVCRSKLIMSYSTLLPSNLVQTFHFLGDNESLAGFFQIPLDYKIPQEGIRLYTRDESIASVTHSILTIPGVHDQLSSYYQQPGQSFGVWVVPAGHYFMMGDNRDNSADSRYWGFVPERNLIGKATAIWMSFDKQEGEWPKGVRLNRIGGIH